jgi:hypothetical protein
MGGQPGPVLPLPTTEENEKMSKAEDKRYEQERKIVAASIARRLTAFCSRMGLRKARVTTDEGLALVDSFVAGIKPVKTMASDTSEPAKKVK